MPGVELRLGRAFSLDASVSYIWFKTDAYDLSPVNQPDYSSGTAWEARLGATWIPHGGQPESEAERDAWGVRKSYGWSAGEMLAINYGAGLINEYIRDANFNQTSPRSWWANIEEGFTYDDNKFKANQWAHPFNGASYFSSSRANGIGFWPSTGFALAGAFYWECCGETHPMSINDLIATSLGGISTGEARDLILFYEYFHGDIGAGLGASHQTGWTGLIARLLDLFGRMTAQDALETPKERLEARIVRQQVGGE